MRRNLWLSLAPAAILSAMLFTVSCSKKVVQTQPAPTVQQDVPKAPDRSVDKVQPPRAVQAEETVRATSAAALDDENVHFAFDSYMLSDQARQILKKKAEFLRANQGVKVTVEGHCDDRGTVAYNLALGERRAETVKNYLVALGVSAGRLKTISYGEERPLVTGKTESAWAQNRRAQFMVN